MLGLWISIMSQVRTLFSFLLALVLAIATVPLTALAAPDPDSAALTEYLHNHRLPAVGAQITVGEDGARSVMLYGFVATQRGFDDAAKRTRDYLHDPYVRITNRIKIEPELLALNRNRSQSSSSGDDSQEAANAPPPVAENTTPPADVGDIQQYQAQNQNNDPYATQGQSSLASGSSLLIPLIGGLIAYGALGGFGSSSYSAPPSYYTPPPPTYYNYNPRPPAVRRRRHGWYRSPSTFSAPPPVQPYRPLVAAAPSLRYTPPPRFSPPPLTPHWYSGGYHPIYGGAPRSFGGGFGGGFHGGHR